MRDYNMMLLVGDNPFHGISHLSQARSRARGIEMSDVEHLAALVEMSLANGANGFMFSVSDVTLSILQELRKKDANRDFGMYAIIPYAYELVRLSTRSGGVSDIGKKILKQVMLSGNVKAVVSGMKGVVSMDLAALLETYALYEISRIESSASKHAILNSVLLHEVVTDMALALGLDWLLEAYIDFMRNAKISPGFETRNFSYLTRKFAEWDISFNGLTIAAPFNAVGFQMSPSQEECEKALTYAKNASIIAMSILASGYLKPSEAVDYVKGLPNLSGVVVGVSKEQHARETFRILVEKLK